MHLAIFWGMAVLFLGTIIATVDQDFLNLPLDVQMLRGKVYCVFELMLDMFGVALIGGIGLAAWRRYVVRPERLKPAVAPISKWDGFPFLFFLFAIAVTGFIAEGLRIAEGQYIDRQLAAVVAGDHEARMHVLESLGVEKDFHLLGAERRQQQLTRIADEADVFPAAVWAPVGYGLAKLMRRFRWKRSGRRIAAHGGSTPCWPSPLSGRFPSPRRST